MTNRRQFLQKTVLGTGAVLFGHQFLNCSTNKNNPNIVLVLTDDQGWGDITSHGNTTLETPVMDKIAAEGIRFDRFYVSPVCAPTRASLLTGRYHLRTGVHGVTRCRENMRLDEVTIAQVLKDNGYATGCFGKWHNGAHYPYSPNGKGFDEFFGFCAGHWNNYFDTTFQHNHGFVKSQGYMADVMTDQAIQFIDQNKSQPFFCYMPYNPPHSPFQVPDAPFKKYKAKGLDDELACIYAMCENLDDNIGRILQKLDDEQLTENTIVIFITDNGPNSARYNGDMRGTKGSNHEGGSRVPCFIRWPEKIKPGKKIEQITSHIDIFPTLVDLCGLNYTPKLPVDGKSLVPLILNENTNWQDRFIFTHWGNRGAVRSQTHRLIVNPSNVQLYDMVSDPGEQNDISSDNVALKEKLEKAYRDWYADVTKDGFEPISTPIAYKEEPLVILPGHEAYLYPERGKGIAYNVQAGWANDWVTEWTDKNAYPYWQVEIIHEGEYEISLEYYCEPENVGAKFSVEIGDQNIQGKVDKAYSPTQIISPDRVKRKEVYEMTWAQLPVGKISLTKGRKQLAVKALSKPGNVIMDLKAVHVKRLG